MAQDLAIYARTLFKRLNIRITSGEVLAKILTRNDDSGRHGVLIPGEGYSFFPDLQIPAPTVNATAEFESFDAAAATFQTLTWKYYQRYPERRVTRLNSGINAYGDRIRLAVFLRGVTGDGRIWYGFDYSIEGEDPRFPELMGILFAEGIPRIPGAFVRLPIDAPAFAIDPDLRELLARFDDVSSKGWIQTQRAGDTGIGYTFESLIGIEENNDKRADFRGIEVKCKLAKNSGSASGKTNLFQQGPEWIDGRSAIHRLRAIGQYRDDGAYACYSQVTVDRNNLGLALRPIESAAQIDLLKHTEAIGKWPFALLQKRLEEKHSRAVFVKAASRVASAKVEYRYSELIYCERPSIERFVDLVGERRIVFEFLMRENPDGSIRNHGYPWRLTHQSLLDQLFGLQVKLRG